MSENKRAEQANHRTAALRGWLVAAVLGLLMVGLALVVFSQRTVPSGPWPAVMLQLGSTLVAAALVSLFYEYSVRRLYIGLLTREVARTAERVQPVLRSLADVGIVEVHPNRNAIQWLELIDGARSSVRILGTSLRFWETVAADGLKAALDRGCKVQLLSLDDSGACATERGRELPEFATPEQFVFDVRDSRAQLERLGCPVQTYDSLPGFVFSGIDSRMFVCFLTNISRGRNSIHFEIEPSSSLAEKLTEKFDALWHEDAS